MLTNLRIVLVPVIVAGLVRGSFAGNLFAAIVFLLASITDYFDGHLARKYNTVSNLGKFMDPIADKILVTSILVLLVTQAKVDPYMVMIILARDTLIGGLRQVAAADQVIIAAQASGKWKTAMQMIAIPAVMMGSPIGGVPIDKIGYFVLWLSTILSVTSGIQYYWGYLKAQRDLKK